MKNSGIKLLTLVLGLILTACSTDDIQETYLSPQEVLENQVQEILDTKFKKESDSRVTTKSANSHNNTDCYGPKPYFMTFQGEFGWEQQLDLINNIQEQYNVYIVGIYVLECCTNKVIIGAYECDLFQKLIDSASREVIVDENPGVRVGVLDIEDLQDEDISEIDPRFDLNKLENEENSKIIVSTNPQGIIEYITIANSNFSVNIYKTYQGNFSNDPCYY